MERWGNDKIFKFLNKYRELTCLWDYNDPYYGYRNARLLALKNLIVHMNLSGCTCEQMEKKIHSILSTYMAEKRRILQKKQLGIKYVPKLSYFKIADAFLDKVLKNRKSNNHSVTKQMNISFEKEQIDKANEIIDEELNDGSRVTSLTYVKEKELRNSRSSTISKTISQKDKWDNDKLCKFVDKYRELTCLWDYNDLNYRNSNARNLALQTLIEYMNVPEWDCKQMYKKIHSIRKAYMFEKRRVLKSKRMSTNKEDHHVPKLVYFKKADAFLNKVVKYRSYENRLVSEQYDGPFESDETMSIFENQETDEHNEADNEINKKESNDDSRLTAAESLSNFDEVNKETRISDSQRIGKKNKWGTVQICKLLDKYRELPCLWNSTDSNYRNHHVRLQALQNLIKHMNVPEWSLEQMDKKIKAIRGTYMNEKRRVLKSKMLKIKYEPKLAYYKKADEFLDEKIIYRNYENSLASQQFVETLEQDEAMYYTSLEEEQDKILKILKEEENECNETYDNDSNDDESNDEEYDDKISDNNSTTFNSKIEAKKFSLFGKFIAQQLNELPLMNAYKLEAEIQQLISNEKIQILNEIEEND